MIPLYPLRMEPLFRQYLWGGRKLATHLGKPIGPEGPYAESWEVCDHGADQSRVAFGPLAGTTLGELVRHRGEELLGRHAPQPQFPLLLKFLDCHQNLSIQVHPNDQQAARLEPPDQGKTEAWYIIEAEPGATAYVGLKRGVDRAALQRAIERGTLAECLQPVPPQPGDVLFVPAGMVHALGAGLLVAEIQQASDTTFRLDDWGRLGPDGKPRPLHVAQALEVIDFSLPPGEVRRPQPSDADRPHLQRLVECDKFVLSCWSLHAPRPVGGDDRCHLLAVLEGAVGVAGDPASRPLRRGETMLLPAASGAVQLAPSEPTTVLEVHLP